MSEIVKSAFIEGRETDVSYDKSQAKIDQFALDIFTSNEENFNGHEMHKNMPLVQIDPLTGERLGIFQSRLAAALWIVKNVLKITGDDKFLRRRAICITGNLHMCMRCGYKSYGYYWKIIPVSEYDSHGIIPRSSRAIPVWCLTPQGKQIKFNSISKAVDATSIPSKVIRLMMTNKSYWNINNAFNNYRFEPLNHNPSIKKFVNMDEALKKLKGIYPEKFIEKCIRTGTQINNVTYGLRQSNGDSSTQPCYEVREVVRIGGGAVTRQFSSMKQVAKYLNCDDKTVKRHILSQAPIRKSRKLFYIERVDK